MTVTMIYEFTYPDEKWLTKVLELELEKLANQYKVKFFITQAVHHE